MTAIRGANSGCSCPVCLCPNYAMQMSDIQWDFRTVHMAYDIINTNVSKTRKQAQLKEMGLRLVDVSVPASHAELELTIFRTRFGKWLTATLTLLAPGTSSTPTRQACLGSIYSSSGRRS